MAINNPMTTPEPSPLSEQDLKALEEYTRSLVCCVCDGPDSDGDHDDDCQAPFWQKVSRAIAQARAAQSALDHAAMSLHRYNEANAALQHMAACRPYLKEGEYPEECIERWRKDCDALMTVLAQRTRELEEARAARPSPTCATCRRLDIEGNRCGHPMSPVRSLAGYDIEYFGCTLHEPAPPAQDGQPDPFANIREIFTARGRCKWHDTVFVEMLPEHPGKFFCWPCAQELKGRPAQDGRP